MAYPFDFKFRPGEKVKTVDGVSGWVKSVIIDKCRSKPYQVELATKKIEWFGEIELLEIK